MDPETPIRLRQFAPFSAMDPETRAAALRRGVVKSVARGTFLIHEGDSHAHAYFLLDGEVETLAGGRLQVRRVRAGDRAAREELGAGDPRPVSVRTLADARVFVVPRSALVATPGSGAPAGGGAVEREAAAGITTAAPAPVPDDFDWVTRLLRSELFKRIPVGNVHRIITQMERIGVRAGDVIIRQGNVGDYFYHIRRGHAEVTRRARPHGPQMRLAIRGAGESFGEEALASDAERNATVTMLTDGELLRLSKRSFVELIRKPALNSVSYGQAQMLVRGGARWLDVRFPEDHERSGIQGSLNLPLDDIRTRAAHLDREQRYVVYCDIGRESSAAAFLLTELGFDVCYLAGGLLHALASVRAASPVVLAGPGDADAGAIAFEAVEHADARTRIAEVVPRSAPGAIREVGLAGADGDAGWLADGPEVDPHTDATLASVRVGRLVNQLAEVKTQLLASMRLKAIAEDAHLGAERALTAKLAELRDALGAETQRAQTLAKVESALKHALEDTQAHTRRAERALGRSEARARRLERALVQAQARNRELCAELDRSRSEGDELQRRVLQAEVALETERAELTAELDRLRALREEAAQQLEQERHSRHIESEEIDQELTQALTLRREAEVTMKAAVQIAKDKEARGARGRGSGFHVVGSQGGRRERD